MPLDVLFVCTGNVCRSPAAAALTRALAAPAAGLRVGSAGLSALVGAGIDPPVAAELAGLGVPTDHRARQYEPWLTLDAGLVLTATHAQAQHILRDVPQALRRVFTINEFARLAEQTDGVAETGPRTVAKVAAMRGRVPAVDPALDDIVDPYRRSQQDAKAAVDAIADAVRRTLTAFDLLAPPDQPPTGPPDQLPTVPRRRPRPYPSGGSGVRER